MSDPIKKFFDMAHDNDVDDAIFETNFVQSTLNKLENFGKNVGEAAERVLKPSKPANPVPNYEQSAFIKPKKETTLYNVTNLEKKVPIASEVSRVFKNTSYSVRGFTASANYKTDSDTYSVFAGERTGIGWKRSNGSYKESVKATYNVGNGKTQIEYSQSSISHSYSVSLFNQRGNNGITASYSNRRGIHTSASVDENSGAISFGYEKQHSRYELDLSAYATTGDKFSNPYAGVAVRMTF